MSYSYDIWTIYYEHTIYMEEYEANIHIIGQNNIACSLLYIHIFLIDLLIIQAKIQQPK